MKRPKKPTRAQKLILSYYHLKPETWLVISETDTTLVVINRYTDTVRELNTEGLDLRSEFRGRKGKK